ncbi:MAG: MBL fold metallo-hydrolase [Raoultibacter sp.]|jgi:glyoxylase-like metal-dependent hydrolase (beta-lactamase superfamily II)
MSNDVFRLEMEEVAPDIFQIHVPSLKAFGRLNSYLIRGNNNSALVDVGYDADISKTVFDAALDKLGISWDSVSILATHAHADHLGGLERIWKPGMPVFSSMDDLSQQRRRLRTRFDNFLPPLRAFKKNIPDVGTMLDEEVEAAMYSPRIDAPLTTVHDGDVIEIGNYKLEVIETPGHDFCEICFWEPENKIMFSGDHIIESITPSIYVEGFDDELGDFFESLEKVSRYDAKLILPGHGHVFTDIKASTQKIINHHTRRVDQTFEIVSAGTKEFIAIVYTLLNQPRRIPWEKRSAAGQWKAVCETIGYLNYLEHRNLVLRTPTNESFEYRIKSHGLG